MNHPAEQSLAHNVQQAGAPSTVEGQRAIEEVQAAMTIAQRFPRDIDRALQRIEAECGQLRLADSAVYSYKRDKQLVEGPSIRLLEVFSRHWQNLEAGWGELYRTVDPTTGYQVAKCRAYAWDLESNSRELRQFDVVLARFYKDKPSKALLDPRDQYEFIANNAQRRKRSCMEAIVPQWAIDQAVEWCKATIEEKVQLTDATVEKLIDAYKSLGVTKAQLEEYLDHPLTVAELTRREYMRLRSIGQSIKEGEAKAKDFFGAETPDQPDDVDLTAQVNQAARGGNGAKAKAAKPKPAEAPEQETAAPAEADVFAEVQDIIDNPDKYEVGAINEYAALSDAITPERREEYAAKLKEAHNALKGGPKPETPVQEDSGVQGAFFGE